MHNLNRKRALDILYSAKEKKVAVIGDVMLDRYFWGTVTRISPEAPVPVIDVDNETFHLGGAANVAMNLASLGIKPVMFGLIGDDNSGRQFISIANSSGIQTSGLFVDKDRPTTVKTRIIGNNQQIARIDREVRDSISNLGELFIVDTLRNVKDLAAIIIEDYNKGVLSKHLIKDIITFGNDNNIPIFVDPKSDNFFLYKNVTLIKPNRKEAQNALGINLRNSDDVITGGKKLLELLNCQNVLITLGHQGMMLFQQNGDISSVPTHARSVADVSGAGDTAIAVLAACWIGGANPKEASSLANHASGLVVEKPGIVSIDINELIDSVKG